MIEALLLCSMLGPLAAALVLGARLVPSERVAAHLAQATALFSVATSLSAVGVWLAHGEPALVTPTHVLFERGDYRFTFELAIDSASVVFLVLVQFTTGMVLRFSRFYLHREAGFQRFFATVLMFEAAMCALTLAGNLDVMFAGWEMVGLSSFLLIAFYRDRHSAVRNALKTYSVYRVADMGMLLAASLRGTGSHAELGLLLLLAAVGKSAQFPFSFWVPRAMEGPTPSSALFYGALSVHAGAYLLLRTFPLWGDATGVRVCVGLVGLLTAALCSMFSRAQPTIKGQVGYASVTQVGLIFVELALGLRTLALVHMVCNALLRCYQLLVSPSAVAYLLRRQASAGSARAVEWRSSYARWLPDRWVSALYVFALSEGYLKEGVKWLLWSPLRRLGWIALRWRIPLLALGGLVLASMLLEPLALLPAGRLPAALLAALALLLAGCGLASWRRPLHSVAWIASSSVAIASVVVVLAPAANRFAGVSYAASVAVFGALGWLGTAMAVDGGGRISRYAGCSDAGPIPTALALLSALGIAGAPLFPTFVGEDLLLHDSLRASGALSVVITSVLALNGYLAVRNFAFTFLGPRRPELRVSRQITAGFLTREVRATDGVGPAT